MRLIIDDIVGIILLTFVFGFTAGTEEVNSEMFLLIGKIFLFFIFAILAGLFILKPFFFNLKKLLLENSVLSLAIVTLFLYSWFAEKAGLAAITGAYCAGLFLGQTDYKLEIRNGISNTGKAFFVDVFFVSIGLEFNLLQVGSNTTFILLFVLFSLMGK